jgi:hypothetical protein
MIHQWAMTLVQHLPASLTPLDVALAALLRGVEPLPVVEVPLREALGCVTAELPPLKAYPSRRPTAGRCAPAI